MPELGDLDSSQRDIVNNIRELYESEQKYIVYMRTVIDQVIFMLAPSEHHARSIMQTMSQQDESTRWLLPATYDFNYELQNIEVNNPRNRNMTELKAERQATFFSEGDWVSLFSGLPNIYIFSMRLLLFFWDFQSYGIDHILSGLGYFCADFNAYISQFDIYTYYVNAYDFNINLLSEILRRNESLARRISKVTQNYSLSSILIMPIQRVPRYELFVKNLLKAGSGMYCDKDIYNTLDNMRQAASSINDALADHYNRQILRQIRDYLLKPPPGLVQPHRILVKHGTAIKQCRKADKPRYVWLFNDCIMYASINTGLLHSAKIYTLAGASCRQDATDLTILADRKSFILKFYSNSEAYAWMVLIQRQISHFEENYIVKKDVEKTAPIWEKDEDQNNCSICGQYFSVVKRRHHCRKCGRLVCAECSRGKQMLDYVDAKRPVRVCDMCFWDELDGKSDSD